MNKECIIKLHQANQNNERVALVSITESNGSSPARLGQNMVVSKEGITGTCGGGLIEAAIIKNALKALDEGVSKTFSYDLQEVGMSCGGYVNGFIQVPPNDRNLVIVGGGHIGMKLYEITKSLNFDITIVDDREEFASQERFPNVETISGKYKDVLTKLKIDANTFVVLVSRSHKTDLEALLAIIERNPKYIGMIGSTKKTKEIHEELTKLGLSGYENLYGPIGLDIASKDPGEIAIAILAEILLIKNNGSLKHMRLTEGDY